MAHAVAARALVLASIGVALSGLQARADVDLTGQWQVQVENEQPFPQFSGVWTFSHTIFGITTLEAQSPTGLPFQGDFDPVTGLFSVISDPPQCEGPFAVMPRLDGTVAASGVTFEATFLKPGNLPPTPCTPLEFHVTAQRVCGNGMIDPGEQCDDGNARSGDCCSTTCQLEPVGQACGTCGACGALGACVVAPRPEATCKRPVKPGAAKLIVKNLSPDTRDSLQWKWTKGEMTTLAEYGHPDTADDYALCVFDASSATPAFVLGARAPAGSDWRTKSTGFSYKSLTLAPDGLQTVTLKAGAAGKAKAIVKGKGDLLPLPASASPLPLPLLVQLQGAQGGCWEARFESATVNDGVRFKAAGD